MAVDRFREAVAAVAARQIAARPPGAAAPAPAALRVERAAGAEAFLRAAARPCSCRAPTPSDRARGPARAISSAPGVLRLAGDPGDSRAMLAALRLADSVAARAPARAGALEFSGVDGPAALSEAFARQLCFRRRARAETRGGLRVFSRRRGVSGAAGAAPGARAVDSATSPRPTSPTRGLARGLRAEGGVPEDRRTPGLQALAISVVVRQRRPSVYVRRAGDTPASPASSATPRGRRVGLVYAAGPPAQRPRGRAPDHVARPSSPPRAAPRAFTAIVVGAPPPGAPAPPPLDGLGQGILRQRGRDAHVECQRRHWSVHKVVCQARAVAPAPAPRGADARAHRGAAAAAILGVARDCARFLGPSLRALERVAEKLFDGAAAWIVFENDSVDDTGAILERFAAERPHRREALRATGLDKTFPRRTERIARARNLALERLEARGWLEGLDYVVVADLDDVNADIDVAGAAAALWHLEVRFSARAAVPVLSAFGGLAIYRAAKLKDRRDAAKLAPARYDGGRGHGAAGVPPALVGQDCEHAFHAALRAYHGGALAVCVHPRLLNCPGQAARDPHLLRARRRGLARGRGLGLVAEGLAAVALVGPLVARVEEEGRDRVLDGGEPRRERVGQALHLAALDAVSAAGGVVRAVREAPPRRRGAGAAARAAASPKRGGAASGRPSSASGARGGATGRLAARRDAFDGVALARRFASCRRGAAEYGRLERSTAAAAGGPSTFTAQQKVASRWFLFGRASRPPAAARRRRRPAVARAAVALLRHGPETLATRGSRRFAEPQRLWDRCDNGSFGFTFVRDPLAAFLGPSRSSAARQKRSDLAFLAPSLRMPRGNATAVLAAYVADARRGAPLGRLSLHTWPQAFRVDALRAAALRVSVAAYLMDASAAALHKALVKGVSGEAGRPPAGRLAGYVAARVAVTLVAVELTRRVSPIAAGSGIPETKSVLAGFSLPGFLTLRTLVAKVGGVVLLLGAGLPVGKEGPFIHTAAIFAEQLLSLSYFRVLNDTPEFRHQMLSAAAAVGVSAAFGAPIGGIMFSIEATATFYVTAHYWGAFFAATCGAFVSRELGYDDYAAFS
ncbi:voltage-gated chloride channel [Aureococcus anophagefferens]|nr:voltage-gated chloride channel [Aureococcus anophagefferens]